MDDVNQPTTEEMDDLLERLSWTDDDLVFEWLSMDGESMGLHTREQVRRMFSTLPDQFLGATDYITRQPIKITWRLLAPVAFGMRVFRPPCPLQPPTTPSE